MKLIIGDPKSIKYRDDYEEKTILEKLRKIVRCPLCGAINIGEFEFDRVNKNIGWNFDCNEDCPNSFEAVEYGHGDNSDLYSDFNGKF